MPQAQITKLSQLAIPVSRSVGRAMAIPARPRAVFSIASFLLLVSGCCSFCAHPFALGISAIRRQCDESNSFLINNNTIAPLFYISFFRGLFVCQSPFSARRARGCGVGCERRAPRCDTSFKTRLIVATLYILGSSQKFGACLFPIWLHDVTVFKKVTCIRSIFFSSRCTFKLN